MFLWVFCYALTAQTQSKQTNENKILYIDSLLEQESFQEAFPLLLKEADRLKDTENWSTLAHVYLWLGEAAYALADPAAALTYTQTAEEIINLYLDQNTFPEYGLLLQNLGVFYSRAGNFDQQMAYYQRHFTYTIKTHGRNSTQGADAFYNLGLAYLRRNQWDKTQAYLDTSLQLSRQLDYAEGIGDAMNILSTCYANNGDYARAIAMQRQALRYETFGNNYSVKLNNLAEYQLNLGQYEVAEENFARAMEEGPNNWGPRLNLIRLYRLQERWEKAENLTDDWIEQLTAAPQPYHSELKRLYNYKASFFQRKEDWSSALQSLLKGQQLRPIDPTIDASIYLGMASAYFGKGEHTRALEAIRKSFQLLFPQDTPENILDNPGVESLLNAEVALEMLTLKGQILRRMLMVEQDKAVKAAAIRLYQEGEQLIQRNRERYASAASKSLLAQAALKLYQDAIELMYLLYQDTEDKQWIRQALFFSERSRATAIADRLNTIQASLFAQIPSKLLDKEKELQGDITFYNHQIASAGTDLDPQLRQDWEQILFEKRNEQEALLQVLKRDYPQYFDLKYQDFTLDLERIRSEVLQRDEVLIEYFIGEEQLYLFWLNGDSIGMEQVGPFKLIEKGIQAFRQGMLSQGPAYQEWAYRLQVLLLKPIQEVINDKSLIIIPDGVLGYVPFETLLLEEMSEEQSFAEASFLLFEHPIRYFFSIQVALLGQQLRRPPAKAKILGISPGFIDSIPFSLSEVSAASSPPAYLPPLKGTLAELETMQGRYSGTFLSGKKATKDAFWKEVPAHGLLHIATHTWIDDKNPNASGFLFAAEQQDSIYSFLHAYELFNQSLLADLVTLSACNTGYGRVQKGEGIASLARAFAFAGCQNLVMTLWPIRDRSTPEIMGYFYDNLFEGMSKDLALHQAKINYLETANPLFLHPYFWGGLIYVGDKGSVALQQRKRNNALVVGGIAVLTLFLLWLAARYLPRRTSSY